MQETKKNGTAVSTSHIIEEVEHRIRQRDNSLLMPRNAHSARSYRPTPSRTRTKLLTIDYNDGQATCEHPALRKWTGAGWRVKSASPRLIELEGTKLFVVLTKDESKGAKSPTASRPAKRPDRR